MQDVVTQFHTFGSAEDPFHLFNGQRLDEVTVAYETYGELNAAKDNAVLLFHAFSGSQHAAGRNESVDGVALWRDDCHDGWWHDFVGPDKALNTDRFFVVCCNYLGGCYGSTGPRSMNPATGEAYAGDFPHVRFADIVDAQMHLLDHLGINKLHGAVGASLGGILASVLATRHPQRVNAVISLSSGVEVPVLTRIQNFEQISAIERDANYKGGHYYGGEVPNGGLALARMIAHKTYVSLGTLVDRARKEMKAGVHFAFYDFAHSIESYMYHQGEKFVKRFDANTYLRILDAWNHFDLASEARAESIAEALAPCGDQRWLIFSIDSDVCFYPSSQKHLASVLKTAEVPYQHMTVHSGKGHDAFLLQPELFTPHLSYFLENGSTA